MEKMLFLTWDIMKIVGFWTHRSYYVTCPEYMCKKHSSVIFQKYQWCGGCKGLKPQGIFWAPVKIPRRIGSPCRRVDDQGLFPAFRRNELLNSLRQKTIHLASMVPLNNGGVNSGRTHGTTCFCLTALEQRNISF